MSERRDETEKIDPVKEDFGLFRRGVVEITVDLTPLVSRNNRGDLVVLGFATEDTEIDVVFPGRRAKRTSPLLSRLADLASERQRAAKDAGRPVPTLDRIRYPIRVEGTWRPRFIIGDDGWQTRRYQLLAARWTVTTRQGVEVFGDSPIVVDAVQEERRRSTPTSRQLRT